MRVRDGLPRRPALRLRPQDWLSGTELARLRDEDGVTEIDVAGPVRLDQRDPAGLVSWLVSLRDAASALIDVHWHGEVSVSPALVSDIVHLAPPAGAATTPWHNLHAGSALYFRRGPGFLSVKDIRRSRRRMRITLDDPLELDLFDRVARPVEVGELTGLHRQLDDFLDAGLVCRVGDLVVGLATHMRRWPIPYTAI